MALDTELRYFESIKGELLQHHEGKYALVIVYSPSIKLFLLD